MHNIHFFKWLQRILEKQGRFDALYFSEYKMEHIPKGGRNKSTCQNGAPLTLCNGHVPEKL